MKRMVLTKNTNQEGREKKGTFIIPAIDIIDGRCVRLTMGDYNEKKIYNEFPLEVAKRFEDSGFRRLHLVDLDGAKEGRVRNWKVLEAIAGKTGLIIDFGGGLKSEQDVRIAFDSGAALATVGSIAVENEPEFERWILMFGAERFLLGADVKDEKIAVKGWQELTTISIFDLLKNFLAKGIGEVFCTDIRKDGKLEGPSLDLYKKIMDEFPGIRLIASGGVSSLDDVSQLQEAGCSAIIIGKAIYEGRISLADLAKVNNEGGKGK